MLCKIKFAIKIRKKAKQKTKIFTQMHVKI